MQTEPYGMVRKKAKLGSCDAPFALTLSVSSSFALVHSIQFVSIQLYKAMFIAVGMHGVVLKVFQVGVMDVCENSVRHPKVLGVVTVRNDASVPILLKVCLILISLTIVTKSKKPKNPNTV